MGGVAHILHTLTNYGPAVFLPIIMLAIGLVLRMKFLQAASSAILLGVAFAAVSLVIGYILAVIGQVGNQMISNTGLHLSALDIGWTPAAAISWAWKFAALGFVIEIVVNIVMLWAKWTDILNVDMWNVWHLSWMGALITMVTGSYVIALIADIVWVAMQLKIGQYIRPRVQEMTDLPGVTSTHPMFFNLLWLYPVYLLVNRIPGINKIKISPQSLRDRLGIFGENHVLGFIIGCLIGIAAGDNVAVVLQTGIEAAAALTLFPMVSSLFMRALVPISEAATEFMKARFPGRMFYVGLDWPILAGVSTIWTVSILLIPFVLLATVVLPGNMVLPFGSVMFIGGVVPGAVLTRGDMVKTWIMSIIMLPLYFYAATWLAPLMTRIAVSTGVVKIPPHVHFITWLNQDTPGVTWFMAQVPKMFENGRIILPVVLSLLAIGLGWLQVRYWHNENKKSTTSTDELKVAEAE